MFRDLALTEDARIAHDLGISAPRVAIVAGSGLGGLASQVSDRVEVAYDRLPGVPRVPGVVGHSGVLVGGTIAEVPVVVFGGRVHRYQGVTALDSAFTARLAAALGAEVLVVTNAAGGIDERLRPGDLMVLSDQVNLTGDSPLVGWTGPEGGNPFVPMRDAFDPELRDLMTLVAAELEIPITEGVYFGLLGPAYETPAEVEMLRRLGADVVGMSTVPEVIAARALGLRVLGVSLVTNVAAGHGLSHEEVLEEGRKAAENLERLMVGILRRL